MDELRVGTDCPTDPAARIERGDPRTPRSARIWGQFTDPPHPAGTGVPRMDHPGAPGHRSRSCLCRFRLRSGAPTEHDPVVALLHWSVSDLTAVWHSYGIEVEAPNPDADIIHTRSCSSLIQAVTSATSLHRWTITQPKAVPPSLQARLPRGETGLLS